MERLNNLELNNFSIWPHYEIRGGETIYALFCFACGFINNVQLKKLSDNKFRFIHVEDEDAAVCYEPDKNALFSYFSLNRSDPEIIAYITSLAYLRMINQGYLPRNERTKALIEKARKEKVNPDTKSLRSTEEDFWKVFHGSRGIFDKGKARDSEKSSKSKVVKEKNWAGAQDGTDTKCIICGKKPRCPSYLSNGGVYHKECLEKIYDQQNKLMKTLEDIQEKKRSVAHQLNDINRSLDSIFGFFSRQENQSKKSNLEKQLSKITLQQDKLGIDISIIYENKLKPLYDYWLDYPPDWANRSWALRSEIGRCETCHQSQRLQTHHRLPISKGGSHKKSNLQVLCDRCHKKEHGGRFREPSKTGTKFSKNLNVIDSAIKERSRLKIKYANSQRVKSTRIIRPTKLIEIPFNHIEGKSLCVEAYCELRKEKRNFAVRKILSVVKVP